MSSTSVTPRLGARVLLLDPLDRVLLLHARDPEDPDHHWWELPGGGVGNGEDLADAARRELAEESGILLLQPHPQHRGAGPTQAHGERENRAT